MSQQSKELKFNYLDESFEKGLQRSYDRQKKLSPVGSLNSPSLRSPARSLQRSSEFSPYQNKDLNIRQKLLVQQLKSQNNILNEQITQYKVMIDNLHLELRSREEELNRISTIFRSEQDKLELKIRQMVQEINILLTKNTYLQQRSIMLQKQLQKEKIEKRRSVSISAVPPQTKSKLNTELSHLLFPQKVSHSKLMNQSFSSKPSPKANSHSDEQIIQKVNSILRNLNKHQELVSSIIEMHHKITNKNFENKELKLVWKWLKELGHNYNIIQKWKKILFDLLHMEGNVDLLTIDEVLQRTVVSLHQK